MTQWLGIGIFGLAALTAATSLIIWLAARRTDSVVLALATTAIASVCSGRSPWAGCPARGRHPVR